MRRGQHRAGFGGFVEQRDTHVDRPFGIVFEAVLPVGIVEVDFEGGVADERQLFTADSTRRCNELMKSLSRCIEV